MSQIKSKLSVALEVMHECFEPIIDPFSRRDIIVDVIFQQRFKAEPFELLRALHSDSGEK